MVHVVVPVVRGVRRAVHDQVVAVLHRRVFDVVLVPRVLDERRAVVVPVDVVPVLGPVVVRVVVGLEERVEQQHLADDGGHQRQDDEDFDLHQYHAQHAREHRARGGQVALDPSAGLWNRKKIFLLTTTTTTTSTTIIIITIIITTNYNRAVLLLLSLSAHRRCRCITT